MQEAHFYDRLDHEQVQCHLCPHQCLIAAGKRGICAVRYNSGGRLYTLVADRIIARHLDPIEKKPLFHVYPGSGIYSLATIGCNLRCRFCQNWEISQWSHEHLPNRIEGDERHSPVCPQLADLGEQIPGEPVTPEGIVCAALASGARSIAYTYTEPTIFYELAHETAVLARAQGLLNVFVTNGYINEAPQRELAGVLDAANVDLKFFRDATYRRMSGARLQPVLDAIARYHELGVWIEITTLVIPGVNDSEEELKEIACFIHSLSPEIPWHVSRFHGDYQMQDVPSPQSSILRHALEIGREAGLRYVYVGNLPGIGGEDTYCPGCGARLIHRYGFRLLENRIRHGGCPECGSRIAGLGLDGV
ncbi:AmmeMemoRadiSam system radical SAM enzyme [Caldichromatium japonicum]|uniref:AmmeMemoRadiSam system radical SAM enzyme n=1 Tax=Caldichromatium japonicum TaxID=2699430 RepID=A0A6G7VAR7_9GAMM|nr:AmmeMemoRadiSam system radical SAM enzyme [Caldichromatium japonicum]QIK37000.1 AmmeMemoRadiSam system radical SAM enzyme [Caldichromatium japonicum]